MRMRMMVAAGLLLCLLTVSLAGCGGFNKPLSETVVGEWHGELDVAKWMYQDMGSELGIELSPEPALCPLTLTFNGDGTAVLEMDPQDFAQAAGQVAEPYVNGLFGFDTSGLISLFMQNVGMDMDSDGTADMTYEVNDEDNTIILAEVGEEDSPYYGRYEDRKLLIDMDNAYQTVEFEK